LNCTEEAWVRVSGAEWAHTRKYNYFTYLSAHGVQKSNKNHENKVVVAAFIQK
jgi:hypothetical protein